MARIRPGDEWGIPASAPADLEVRGDDRELARAVAAHPGALLRFVPGSGSDLARAIGLVAGAPPRGIELALDALRLEDGRVAVNMVIAGVAPARLRPWHRAFDAGRADGPVVAVVVAVGEFHHGLDLVPRGHPGDGRAEVHEYRLRPRERAAVRARLATGTHLPHPRITVSSVRAVTLRGARPFPVELDGRPDGVVRELTMELVPGAYRLLV
jgi:diacylglycerol kinase family enzyme